MTADMGKPIQIEANMFDNVIIKGLHTDRKENGTEDDYYINNDIESIGFISYIPKYLSDPKNFTNIDIGD